MEALEADFTPPTHHERVERIASFYRELLGNEVVVVDAQGNILTTIHIEPLEQKTAA